MYRRVRQDSGALTLSYVIIVPVFLLFLMIMIQVALWFLARSTALAAARQGVSAARVQPVSLIAGRNAARAFARTSGSGFLLTPSAFTSRTATTVVVTVTGHVPSLVPGLPIRVSQAAQAPVERFTTP
jgi:Flp pilus assembly protein TadG